MFPTVWRHASLRCALVELISPCPDDGIIHPSLSHQTLPLPVPAAFRKWIRGGAGVCMCQRGVPSKGVWVLGGVGGAATTREGRLRLYPSGTERAGRGQTETDIG